LVYRTAYDHVDLGQARFSEACLACVLYPVMQFSDEKRGNPHGSSLRRSCLISMVCHFENLNVEKCLPATATVAGHREYDCPISSEVCQIIRQASSRELSRRSHSCAHWYFGRCIPSVAHRLPAGREPNQIGSHSMITPQLCTLSRPRSPNR
jgi:hypothetical protein